MAQNPPAGFPTITPYLLYEDVATALDWLATAFGFVERLRFAGDDGIVNHAELELGDGVVMLGDPGADYQNPKKSGRVTQLINVYVDDVDKHFQRAKEAGATIVSELKGQAYGDRSYTADDLEGHRWAFAQHVRDVPPEEWGG